MDSFIIESRSYVIVAGSLQVIAALLLAPFFFPIARCIWGTPLSKLVRAYVIFNCMLLFWGCLGHYVFTAITVGKMYVSADRVVDWYPFIPFGQWVINNTFDGWPGHLIGGTPLWQLRAIWAVIAAPVWLLSYASTVLVMRAGKRGARSSVGSSLTRESTRK